MRDLTHPHKAWVWVMQHPCLQFEGVIPPSIDVSPNMVCPETKMISDDHTENTHLEWWIECGAYCIDTMFDDMVASHDVDLDCGADTMDEAIVKLAQLVLEKYGDYDYNDVW